MRRLVLSMSFIDRALIAPGATGAERLLGYGAGVVGAVFAGTTAVADGLPMLPTVVLVIFGFDLFGGAVVNATPSGSARFHKAGPPGWRAVGFVAAHIHLMILALIVPEQMWLTAIAIYAGIVLSSVLVIVVSSTYRRPIAFAMATVLIGLCSIFIAPGVAIAWVGPALIVKLLLSHLLPHTSPDVSRADRRPGSTRV